MFRHPVNVFGERTLPQPADPVGYAHLIEQFDLPVPWPPRLAAIAERHHPRSTRDWQLFAPGYRPVDSLAGHLEFALKWEGVRLEVLDALFAAVPARNIEEVILRKPTGKYARRLWFLYEWLTGAKLDLADVGSVRSTRALNPDQQFAAEGGALSSRHGVRDNLPGTPDFCPLVWRTEALETYASKQLAERARKTIGQTHPDVVARAAAFLLLGDSRASFGIEGEHPRPERAQRWARAIGEAGTQSLSVEELERLQRIVIGDDRFVQLGLRKGGGFVGLHDRWTREPIPEHISARAMDLAALMQGLVAYAERSLATGTDPVVAAAALSFGFVFVHPFEDGNGRIHRWLIHYVLSRAGYSPKGIVFPVSAVILRWIADYRRVLETHSQPLLRLIDWRPTAGGNVEVLNDTARLYRFFDATAQAEFLYRCIAETVDRDLPQEVAFLEAYDKFRAGVKAIVAMPDGTVDLLHRFLRQEDGRLSRRARTKEFKALTDEEATEIEALYRSIHPAESP